MPFATNGAPYYEQLVMQIKQQIVQEVLRPGDQLPSIRAMASEMHLNPNTVSKAYQILEHQRAVYTVQGRGTFVSESSQIAIDTNAVDDLQTRLQSLLTEAQFLGISAQQVQAWVTTAYQKGESRDEYPS